MPVDQPSPSDHVIRSQNRPAVACERCNRKKVRCDASVNGVPCTRCRRTISKDCRLLKWKRSRGPDGRYNTVSKPDAAIQVNPSGYPSILHSQPASRATTPVQSSVVPEFDIVRLVGAPGNRYAEPGSHGDLRIPSPSTTAAVDLSSRTPHDNGANFVGESWWAHYVLSTSAAAPTELHGFIGRPQTESSTRDSSSSSDAGLPADFPPPHLTRQLIEAYFRRFHIFCPILDRDSFLRSVRDGKVSHTLLRCVFFVASLHCEKYLLNLMGYSTRLEAEDDLFGRARAAFDADEASDRTTMILSSFLLHYYAGSRPRKYRDAMWWMSNAIRSAQSMGYHRSTKKSKMPEKDKVHWKRIWWCLYIRDRQVCLSLGPPMVINDLDFDVEDLTMDDFPNESIDTARYMVAQASLNKIVSNLFFCHCSPRQLSLSHDPSVRERARQQIQNALQEWLADWREPGPGDNSHLLNLILQLCYNYYIINLHQRLQRLSDPPFTDPEGSKLVLEAADRISAIVDDSLLHWTPERFPLIYVSAIFSAMTAQVADCGIACFEPANFSRRLRSPLLALKQFEQCYVVAQWIRHLFMGMVGRNQPRQSQIQSATTDQPHPPDRPEKGLRTELPCQASRSPANEDITPALYRGNDTTESLCSLSTTAGQLPNSATVRDLHRFPDSGPSLDVDMEAHVASDDYSPHRTMSTSVPAIYLGRCVPNSAYTRDGDDNYPTNPDPIDWTDLPFFEARGCHQSLHVLADLGLTEDPSNAWIHGELSSFQLADDNHWTGAK
ncbi:hypothetical protein AYL99_08779 [Fonsecaea erecta]|uniref:Zn(2)-C6 fungal-type domain-containing protein n=1 Tax=Fonsecaea erecta TaxID=1367422 RepID=A0A178ZA71_9EURO|nr:hypothetical protein AYL99_08779 [Fonsecaea erecta]OAP56667.1 hypothetical protein AYL99_08779 [Fonsecaea erecta]